jgi:hypothetical protein
MRFPHLRVPILLSSLVLVTSAYAIPTGAMQFPTRDVAQSNPSEKETVQAQQACRPQNMMIPTNVAMIVNTGSTNTPCYRILVTPAGQVSYVKGNATGSGNLSSNLTRKLFRDIRVAEPLSKLPVQQPCIKSVSFGSSTFVRLGGEASPDVSCPGNAKAQALWKDTSAVARALKIVR